MDTLEESKNVLWRIVATFFPFIMTLSLAIGANAATNLVVNGNFATQNFTSWTVGGTTKNPPVIVKTDGTQLCCNNEAVKDDTLYPLGSPDPSAGWAAYFDADAVANQYITQSLTVAIGGTYEIGFDAYVPHNGFNNNPGNARLTAEIAGQSVFGIDVRSIGAGQWVHFSGPVQIPTNGTFNIIFRFQTTDVERVGIDVLINRIYLIASDAPPASWTPLAHQPCSEGEPCFTAGATLLLTDGRVLVHSEQSNLSDWYTLTPDQYGDYGKGFWTKVASLPPGYAPLYFASAVLPDGRAIIAGGEYNNGVKVWIKRVAIFNPLAMGGLGDWKLLAPPPGWTTIGDAQSVVLPDGSFMLANCCSKDEAKLPAPYNPGVNPWIPTGFSKADSNDEEGWTLLPSLFGDIPESPTVLTVDTNVTPSTCPGGSTSSELYTAATGDWFCPSNTPTQLWEQNSHELGPAVLRPDKVVFQAGAVPHTAFFDSLSLTWSAGPNFTCAGCLTNLDIADGPAALLPNGNVLMMTSPGVFITGAVFFELQFNGNTLTRVPGPPNTGFDSSYYGHMLVLPTRANPVYGL